MVDQKKYSLNNEYEQFLKIEEAVVPKVISKRVLARIAALLNPKAWFVFLKVLAIHLVVGFLSLSICHQFGVNPFQTEKSLADWFMAQGGHGACMIACGILFVGLSYLIAGYFLRVEEIRVIKKTEISQTLVLGLISLLLFKMVGAELILTFVALWMLGGIVGGYLANEAVLRIKTRNSLSIVHPGS